MATKSIGATGRDFATFALHASYLDGLGTLTEPEVGEAYNDAEFSVSGNIATYTGFVASSANTVTIRPATGQGFKDHATAASNPLTYDRSKGVGLKCTGVYSHAVEIQVDHVKLIGLQILHTNASNRFCLRHTTAGLTGVTVDSCILEKAASTSGDVAVFRSGTMQNCLLVQRQSGGGNGLNVNYAGTSVTLLNNTIVRPSDITAGGSAIFAANGTTTVKNCALFGFSTSVNNTGLFTGSNNASDVAIGFGVSNQASVTYADQFEDAANSGGVDFRAKAAGALIDNGTNTGTPSTDIIGQSISNTTRDIGCWELQAVGGGDVTLFPSLVENSQTFFGATVSPGAASVAPGLIANSQTFFGATITAGAVTLQLSLLANDQTFFGATVSPGAATVAPNLVENSQTFHGATVSPGAVTVAPSLVENNQTFHGATVLQGTVVLPSLLTNTPTFFGATVTVGAVTLQPSRFANDNQFFGATIVGGEQGVEPRLVGGGWRPPGSRRRKFVINGEVVEAFDDEIALIKAAYDLIAGEQPKTRKPRRKKQAKKRFPYTPGELLGDAPPTNTSILQDAVALAEKRLMESEMGRMRLAEIQARRTQRLLEEEEEWILLVA